MNAFLLFINDFYRAAANPHPSGIFDGCRVYVQYFASLNTAVILKPAIQDSLNGFVPWGTQSP